MTALVVGTAGHIDHGKSALVHALTGTDPDRLKEEKARGITIDLGFAHAAIGDLTVAFVDVPGHERFVRNMLAGAGGIDAVLLVVAANESVMPQTREHFAICRLLGLTRGVIVLTKIDIADADMIGVAAQEARDLVAGSFLEGAPIVPVSARSGSGLDDLRAALVTLASTQSSRPTTTTPRLPIDRVFTMKGFGTVVTGTLVSGRIAEHDALVALPRGHRVRVRGVQVHGRSAPHVDAPSRLAVNLGAIEVSELARGMTLTTEGGLSVTRRADVCLQLLAGARPLRHGARVQVHQGTSGLGARIGIAAVRASPRDPWRPIGAKDAAVSVPSGGEAFVRLRFDAPVAITRGDRFVVRAESPLTTIGGGVVLDPEPPMAGLRRVDALDRFEQLAREPQAEPAGVIRVWLDAAALAGLDAIAIVRRVGLDRPTADRVVAELVDAGHVIMAGGRAFSAVAVRAHEQRLLASLAAFHRAHPAETGMARESLRTSGRAALSPELFDVMVTSLIAANAMMGVDRLSLASHRPASAGGDGDSRSRIVEIVRAAGLTPPDATAIAASTGINAADVDRFVHALVKERALVRVGELVFHPDSLAILRADIKAKAAAGSTDVDVATFKDRFGLSRKFAIPLLEWLDRERVTRRVGNTRRVL